MSRCGGCDLYWPDGKENFGVSCQGNYEAEECANNLCRLILKLRAALEQSEKKVEKKNLPTKIYGIFSGAYSDWSVHGYFSSAEDAFKYYHNKMKNWNVTHMTVSIRWKSHVWMALQFILLNLSINTGLYFGGIKKKNAG